MEQDYHCSSSLLESRYRIFTLQKAYKTEFAGNIKRVDRKAAEQWAKDYPEVFKEYIKNNAL